MKRLTIASVVAAGLLIAIPSTSAASTYTNPNLITIPDSGPASPYPSTITVDELPGAVTRVRATLHGLVHSFPTDLDVLLVAPNGAKTLLMSDVCGDGDPGEAATGQTFTFDDTGGPLPEGAFCPSGTYRPTRTDYNPTFDPPAPSGPYVASLATLNGSAASGPWQLFVNDAAGGDSGAFNGGWTLDLLTDATCSGNAATLTGTSGDDELVGTEGDDVILGFAGKDEIRGLGGRDLICGGPNGDELRGGSGKDKVVGQGGPDEVRGNGGKDKLRGKGGKDELNGGAGKDTCVGGKKDDTAKKCEVEKSI